MSRPTLVLLHGWGFDAHLWDALAALLSDHPIVRWDRGYFGERGQPRIDGPVVGVGHSLGAMLLADALPPDAPLVAINGFDRFTGPDAVPARVVERMQARFAQSPGVVLTDFRARCGAPPLAADLNQARLGDDLAMLATHRAAGRRGPVLSLQSATDPILPERLRDRVFPGATRATQAEAGHRLPATHAAWCAERIRDFLCR